MRRMRNRILLSGVAALLSAAVVAGPAAASTSDHKSSSCDRRCGPVRYFDRDRDLLDLNLVLKLCLSIL